MSENVVDKCGISSWSSADTDTNLPSDQGETDTELVAIIVTLHPPDGRRPEGYDTRLILSV